MRNSRLPKPLEQDFTPISSSKDKVHAPLEQDFAPTSSSGDKSQFCFVFIEI